MRCYECSLMGNQTEAIGICHHCSTGVCAEHSGLYTHPLPGPEPAAKASGLPSHFRSLLCPHCMEAIRKRPELETDAVCCIRVPRPTFPWG